MFTAVIAELVESKEPLDYPEIQKKLKKIIKDVNEFYEEQIQNGFTVTTEGGIQGLLKSPEKLLEILLKVKFKLHPVKLRFGIGFGEVGETEKMGAGEGSANHLARQMISEVKRMQLGKKALHADMQFGHVDRPSSLDALNAGVCLMHFIEVGWTDKQRENIFDSLFLRLNQSEIALKKKVHQSTVHRSLTAAGFYEYERAFLEFQRHLDGLSRQAE